MDAVRVDSDAKNFFPKASHISGTLKASLETKINSGKSDLANSILREIKEYQTSGKAIEIDMDKCPSTMNERNHIRLLLKESNWKVETELRKIPILNWPFVEAEFDEKLFWKITERN